MSATQFVVSVSGNSISLPSVTRLMEELGTKTQVIRFLHEQKVPKTVIAKHLNVRYQQVRQAINYIPKTSTQRTAYEITITD